MHKSNRDRRIPWGSRPHGLHRAGLFELSGVRAWEWKMDRLDQFEPMQIEGGAQNFG
jgi:hypothetical protein